MEVVRQIDNGILVCPVTKAPLRMAAGGRTLVSEDGSATYPVDSNGVPLLLPLGKEYDEYIRSSERMLREYSEEHLAGTRRWPGRLKAAMTSDHRSKESREAFREVFGSASEEGVFLSVGGGPQRVHPCFTNLNVAPFSGVDVVGDAHCLPYRSDTVDAIYCDAVLEHLSIPEQAVAEMHRVLKPGGRAYVTTPFLQAYHGYPHHYRNFTLTGHTRLFSDRGFRIESAGTCVGPAWVIVSLTATFIRHYVPRPFNTLLGKVWGFVGAGIRPIDRWLNRHEDSHVMASTTFLVAAKRSL